ncbi:Oidioi.mRNA.OKI2018_I69.PAR.g9602.t1.cds [Oikopleura dioica]|uniref:Oidioi.mRNA.OKI2018_I69.PAR.g9602.t1.cds n=1 Tax=Oikopleura dioica TaxID=34765 RepID=A0ABN7RQJ2_OIKDI|nr:Oidioi.mRNA.OKI2018_I69.PAR.g9602.t1.cds [Oikopleura dioica]
MIIFNLFQAFHASIIDSRAGLLKCPDQELQEECNGNCRIVYTQCRLSCEDEFCLTTCERSYEICLDSCPCGENCPQGCKDCENPICPDDLSNMHFAVLLNDLTSSYINSGDGISIVAPQLDAPSNDFVAGSPFAILQDELFIFGGNADNQKIGKLVGCSFSLISASAYLLSGFPGPYEACEIFDGESVSSTHSAQNNHDWGKLGLYKGQPTTVGSYYKSGAQKVETYNSTGWASLPDHPRKINGHTLTGLDSGSLLLIGGEDDEEVSKNVWILKDDVWNILGQVLSNYDAASAIKIGNYVFVVSGYVKSADGTYPVERVHIENDEFLGSEVIGSNDGQNWIPVLFQADFHFCQ